MFKNLSAGAVGIRGLPLEQTIALARETGFEGVEFSIVEAARLVEQRGLDAVQALFADSAIRPGSWGLPVDWRNDDTWRDDVRVLPGLARLGRDLGCTRTATWMLPFSDTRPFAENFAWHVERFRPIAAALAEHDCRFGIEFIGPKTSRAGHNHEFIYTLEGLMELANAIGTGNVGLLLDAWHLYTSGGSANDLAKLRAEDVVVVHVNDAPPGIERDEQIDNVRALPTETGVIDLAGFMRGLAAIGYDGPITVEPFSARINERARNDPRGVAVEVAQSLDSLWRVAGLA